MTKRSALLSALVALVSAAVAASASASTVELGKTATPVAAPTCPANTKPVYCKIVLEHTTALQTASDGTPNPTRVTRDGWIVSFTVGLSKLSDDATTVHKLLHAADAAYGGTPQVALTVLRPAGKNAYTVAAASQSYHLIPFLGQVLQQPLSLPPKFSTFTALPVKRGDLIGLTSATWAPVLSYNLDAQKFTYRQSRTANCIHSPATQTAQTKAGQKARYLCSYTGTRAQYTATEITNTPYPAKYPHTVSLASR